MIPLCNINKYFLFVHGKYLHVQDICLRQENCEDGLNQAFEDTLTFVSFIGMIISIVSLILTIITMFAFK